ncbi:hypothetical protein Tco_1079166 [Tanacetum coccineum]|uniref:Reverse transcriptase domain-containing protein n=1 Tax=Tanacetum coccineum TaxID=301880 RepID=A0ABQ5HR17_9ASTR
MGLWYPKDSGFELIAYSDADHAGCKDDCKSTSGGLQFLGGKLVSWSSKKQDCTTMSTAEAEYVSLSACCTQVIWMRTQLLDYGFKYNRISVYCDSKSAIAISYNPEYQLADIFTKELPKERFEYLVHRIGIGNQSIECDHLNEIGMIIREVFEKLLLDSFGKLSIRYYVTAYGLLLHDIMLCCGSLIVGLIISRIINLGLINSVNCMSPPIHRKYHNSVAFATGCKRIKKSKRCNRKIRIPIAMWPCRVEEKMTLKEVDGQTVEEIETKIIAKDGTITRVPRQFQGYETSEEEPIVTQVTNNVNNANNGNGGNGGGENGNGRNNECTFKSFQSCNPKEYDGKGGAIVLTRWIEKMENMIDNSGCAKNQKVRYAASSLVNKALTWWNTQV